MNWVLLAAVLTVMVVAGSSSGLANAYGLAVTGTLLLESVIFLIFAVLVWRWRWWKIGATCWPSGCWKWCCWRRTRPSCCPGAGCRWLAGGMLVVMTTWQRGFRTVAAYRAELEAHSAALWKHCPPPTCAVRPGWRSSRTRTCTALPCRCCCAPGFSGCCTNKW
ncbi:KUP/HAK/KT family potassium transporter [Arthrobacter sp. JCM 19049]|uniref:KUP/HAK/KT family potassium transporter n=1 Tax=Arthrobacter sp. JCM 19049 TaxID=1460643 RepID=UPI0006D0C73A|nr:KUP/HAK/KT family potassium transporter [Arthrobacter sp. JCM 19049]